MTLPRKSQTALGFPPLSNPELFDSIQPFSHCEGLKPQVSYGKHTFRSKTRTPNRHPH